MKHLDVEKFTRVLGMLGSTFPGERAVAAEIASKMLADAGMTWRDVVAHNVRGNHRTSIDQMIEFCLQHDELLNFWESGFVRGIRGRQYLTEKQLRFLDGIVRKLARARAA